MNTRLRNLLANLYLCGVAVVFLLVFGTTVGVVSAIAQVAYIGVQRLLGL